MIQERPLPLKAICVWCFIIACGLITAYIALISLVSVWVGFTHIGRLGSWIPIVGGTILFVTICSLYFRATKTIWRRLHREEVFDI